jgi:hypothetical protein
MTMVRARRSATKPTRPIADRILALLPRLRAALGPDFEIESSFEG